MCVCTLAGQILIPGGHDMQLQCYYSPNCTSGTESYSNIAIFSMPNICCLIIVSEDATKLLTPNDSHDMHQYSFRLNDGECRPCDGEFL